MTVAFVLLGAMCYFAFGCWYSWRAELEEALEDERKGGSAWVQMDRVFSRAAFWPIWGGGGVWLCCKGFAEWTERKLKAAVEVKVAPERIRRELVQYATCEFCGAPGTRSKIRGSNVSVTLCEVCRGAS